jgi:hypothetical protein
MKEWPVWFPPAEMIERQPYLPRIMAGGEGKPLGARYILATRFIVFTAQTSPRALDRQCRPAASVCSMRISRSCTGAYGLAPES